MPFITHPQIVSDSVEERTYQVSLAKECVDYNSLLILPTGLGKTIVALLVTAEILEKKGKVLILAPTKPLVDQHSSSFSQFLSKAKVGMMNGNMDPEKRFAVIQEHDVIISTPQVVSNDLENERYSMDLFKLVIFDEAHRAIGNYSYVPVAEKYTGLALGMTASPGSDLKKIEEVCDNLSLVRVDMRTEDDPDVSPYVHDIYTNKIFVTVPQDLVDMIAVMNTILDGHIKELLQMRLMDPSWPASTTHMLAIGETLQRRLKRGERSMTVFRGMVVQSICIKMLHAIGLAESQGVSSLRTYLKKIDIESQEAKGNKASKELMKDREFRSLCKMVMQTRTEHPKISQVMGLVSKELNSERNSKVLVFSHYRDTCELLVEKLSLIEGAKVGKLIGQSNGGLRQKEQVQLLNDFREGTYNVVVSTSVGEEGLDVASTDMVIFYEPVPSEIRTIQRRGRTGRKNDGEVYVLIAKGTRDEVFENTSRKKEEKMRSRLERLNRELERRKPISNKQSRLNSDD